MEFAVTVEDRRREIIADLSREKLSAATQAAVMRELRHKASGFEERDLIAIAAELTGERCASAAAALLAVDQWSRGRVCV